MSESTPTSIDDGVVVAIHYTLNLDDGSQVDSSQGSDPLQYIHGYGNIVPGLEKELTGKKVGESFEVKVSPEEGYGPRIEDAMQRVPRTQLPPDVEPQVGMAMQGHMPNGQVVVLHITEVTAEDVILDPNHPLAGENLNFSIEVVSMRAPSQEELEHGHVHGPGGHEH